MDLQEIQDKLNILLEGTERKIVFWYDDDAAYVEEIDQLELTGNSKIRVLFVCWGMLPTKPCKP